MRGALARDLVAALAIALPALSWSPAPALAQQDFTADDLQRMADGLRNGTVSVDFASDECQSALGEHPIRGDLQEIMAGFLDVPEGIAGEAFCRALMTGIKAGDVSVDRVAQMIAEGRDPASDPAGALEFGRILRALYFSHIVTSTVSAEGNKPQ